MDINSLLLEQDQIFDSENTNELISSLLSSHDSILKNLSQFIHDEMGQQLAFLKLFLVVMQQKLRTSKIDQIYFESLLNTCLEQVQSCMVSSTHIIHHLTPPPFDEVSLSAAIHRYLKPLIAFHDSIEFTLDLSFDESRLSKQLSELVYRITQEAIHNALKHGSPSFIQMVFAMKKETLYITVSDNGGGFSELGNLVYFGLKSLRERLLPFNGTLKICNKKGGTQLQAVIPL